MKVSSHRTSAIGCSVQHCCSKYGFTADDIPGVSVKGTDRDFIEKANPGIGDKAHMLLELIFVKNGSLQVRAPIDRPISRESSASPNLVGDRSAHPVCDH